MDASEILVVILSVALAVLLVLAIILAYHLIKISIALRQISQKTAQVVNNVEQASHLLKNSAVPVAMSRLIANMIDNFKTKRHRKEEKDEKK